MDTCTALHVILVQLRVMTQDFNINTKIKLN